MLKPLILFELNEDRRICIINIDVILLVRNFWHAVTIFWGPLGLARSYDSFWAIVQCGKYGLIALVSPFLKKIKFIKTKEFCLCLGIMERKMLVHVYRVLKNNRKIMYERASRILRSCKGREHFSSI